MRFHQNHERRPAREGVGTASHPRNPVVLLEKKTGSLELVANCVYHASLNL